jgi:hypothetical protein
MNPAIVAALSTLLVAYSQPSIAGEKRMRYLAASQPVACDPDSDRQCSPGKDEFMTSSGLTPRLYCRICVSSHILRLGGPMPHHCQLEGLEQAASIDMEPYSFSLRVGILYPDRRAADVQHALLLFGRRRQASRGAGIHWLSKHGWQYAWNSSVGEYPASFIKHVTLSPPSASICIFSHALQPYHHPLPPSDTTPSTQVFCAPLLSMMTAMAEVQEAKAVLASLNRLRWQRRGSQDSLAQPLLGGASARSDPPRSEGPRSDEPVAMLPEQLSPLMVLAYSNVGVLLGALLVPAGLLWPSLLALVYLLVVLRSVWVWAQAGTGHASRRSVALLQVSMTGTKPSAVLIKQQSRTACR